MWRRREPKAGPRERERRGDEMMVGARWDPYQGWDISRIRVVRVAYGWLSVHL